MTHKSQTAYFQWGPFKKINKFNIYKTNTKKLSYNFSVEISQIMTYNTSNAQV